MKAVLGVLALVFVLATVGLVAKRQLQAAGNGSVAPRDAEARARAGLPATAASADLGAIQQDVRDRTAEALRQGAKRNEDADK